MTKHKFLLCVNNEGYEASREIRELYEKIPDKEAARHDQGESGTLFPTVICSVERMSGETARQEATNAPSIFRLAVPTRQAKGATRCVPRAPLRAGSRSV